jgi:hypothetical protein
MILYQSPDLFTRRAGPWSAPRSLARAVGIDQGRAVQKCKSIGQLGSFLSAFVMFPASGSFTRRRYDFHLAGAPACRCYPGNVVIV